MSLEALSASVNKTRLACVFMTEILEWACVCVCACMRVCVHVCACTHVRMHLFLCVANHTFSLDLLLEARKEMYSGVPGKYRGTL